jgi:hypothetical protein
MLWLHGSWGVKVMADGTLEQGKGEKGWRRRWLEEHAGSKNTQRGRGGMLAGVRPLRLRRNGRMEEGSMSDGTGAHGIR